MNAATYVLAVDTSKIAATKSHGELHPRSKQIRIQHLSKNQQLKLTRQLHPPLKNPLPHKNRVPTLPSPKGVLWRTNQGNRCPLCANKWNHRKQGNMQLVTERKCLICRTGLYAWPGNPLKSNRGRFRPNRSEMLLGGNKLQQTPEDNKMVAERLTHRWGKTMVGHQNNVPKSLR